MLRRSPSPVELLGTRFWFAFSSCNGSGPVVNAGYAAGKDFYPVVPLNGTASTSLFAVRMRTRLKLPNEKDHYLRLFGVWGSWNTLPSPSRLMVLHSVAPTALANASPNASTSIVRRRTSNSVTRDCAIHYCKDELPGHAVLRQRANARWYLWSRRPAGESSAKHVCIKALCKDSIKMDRTCKSVRIFSWQIVSEPNHILSHTADVALMSSTPALCVSSSLDSLRLCKTISRSHLGLFSCTSSTCTTESLTTWAQKNCWGKYSWFSIMAAVTRWPRCLFSLIKVSNPDK